MHARTASFRAKERQGVGGVEEQRRAAISVHVGGGKRMVRCSVDRKNLWLPCNDARSLWLARG